MLENNRAEHSVPSLKWLKDAGQSRYIGREPGESTSIGAISARVRARSMQTGNTAKHIVTRAGHRDQFWQQTAITFESAATMFQQRFHRRKDRSLGLTLAAPPSDSRRNPTARRFRRSSSGNGPRSS